MGRLEMNVERNLEHEIDSTKYYPPVFLVRKVCVHARGHAVRLGSGGTAPSQILPRPPNFQGNYVHKLLNTGWTL